MRGVAKSLALALFLTALPLATPAHGLCASYLGEHRLPVVFVGIAMGKDPSQGKVKIEWPDDDYWPHRFRVEQVERATTDLRPGDVVEVDLMVNEYLADGVSSGVEEGLGDAPLVGARYRVGTTVTERPEGLRYHANGCAGSLTRLDDPEAAEPYQQQLRVADDGQSFEEASSEVVGEKGRTSGPFAITAGVLVLGVAVLLRRLRPARSELKHESGREPHRG